MTPRPPLPPEPLPAPETSTARGFALLLSFAAAACPRHGALPGPRTASQGVHDVRLGPAARPFSVSPDRTQG